VIVLGAARIEHVGNQDGVVDRRHVDTVLRQHHCIELQIVPDLENPGISQQRFERSQRIGGLDLVRGQPTGKQPRPVAGLGVTKRHVAGFTGTGGERDAADLRLHRIGA